MILWTIQHEHAYGKMEKTGVLRADKNYIFSEFFEKSYLWMSNQMEKRIGHAPEGVIFPYDETAVYSETEKRRSWENIFYIDCSFDGEEHHILTTQATLWEIKREWVKKAEHFISR